MVMQETPVSRGRLALPEAPRDCPADIVQLINDCTVFNPVQLLQRYARQVSDQPLVSLLDFVPHCMIVNVIWPA